MSATNGSCEVLKIIHKKKVRYYRSSKIDCDLLWISRILSEAIWIIEYEIMLFLSVR